MAAALLRHHRPQPPRPRQRAVLYAHPDLGHGQLRLYEHRGGQDSTEFRPCAGDDGLDFYFAILEELPHDDEITTVEAWKEHYEKYEYLDEYVLFIDIYSDIGEDTDSFLKDRDHRRSLYCTKGIGDGLEIVKWEEADGSMTEHIDITDATEEAVLGTDGKLYSKLCSFIDGAVMNGEDPRAGSETGNVIVILSVNRDEDKILFRDEYKIGRLLDDIAKKYADQNITIAVR